MIVGFLYSSDHRAAISPSTIKKFEKIGCEIRIEPSSIASLSRDTIEAIKSYHSDRSTILRESDIIVCNKIDDITELSSAKKNAVVVSFFEPYNDKAISQKLEKYAIQPFSMDMIPRTTLAQSMDVLSSMASISGYKAVLLAATKLPKYVPMMMTAAGTIRPATVLVIGAGVAGLQAIATARRIGAKVLAFDVRSAVKEEVQSLGAKFVEVEGAIDDKDAGGYAVEQTEEFKKKQAEAIAKAAISSDIVITTAQLRGRPAPKLISTDTVEKMKDGSVIIDLAASTGGNCEVTEDKKEINYHGVCIIGNSELYMEAIRDASDLLANNVFNYTSLFVKDGNLHVDFDNEIIAKSMIKPN